MFKFLVLERGSIIVNIIYIVLSIVLARLIRTLNLYSNKIKSLRTDQPNFAAIHIEFIFTYFLNFNFFFSFFSYLA